MSDPLTDKKVREESPEGLPPDEAERLQKLQAQLVDFILRLIQAFLRTGYYTPDHPESKKPRKGFTSSSRVSLNARKSSPSWFGMTRKAGTSSWRD